MPFSAFSPKDRPSPDFIPPRRFRRATSLLLKSLTGEWSINCQKDCVESSWNDFERKFDMENTCVKMTVRRPQSEHEMHIISSYLRRFHPNLTNVFPSHYFVPFFLCLFPPSQPTFDTKIDRGGGGGGVPWPPRPHGVDPNSLCHSSNPFHSALNLTCSKCWSHVAYDRFVTQIFSLFSDFFCIFVFLTDNGIHDAGAMAFAEVLKSNRSLRLLDLKGMCAFLSLLCGHPPLFFDVFAYCALFLLICFQVSLSRDLLPLSPLFPGLIFNDFFSQWIRSALPEPWL